MKLFIRLVLLSGLFFALFSSTEQIFDMFISNNIYTDAVTGLIAVASIVGFLLFIIFTYLVEFTELRHLVYYHKMLSKWINYTYSFISLIALVAVIIGFDFKRAILISIIHLSLTIAYDYLRERIMLTRDMSRTHPKTII